MKKMKSLLFSILLLTIVGMFSACTFEKENYLTSLPAQSSVVFKFNSAQLITKSNLTNNPFVNGMLMQAAQSIPESLKGKYEEIMNNPNESGIDIQKPIAVAVLMDNLQKPGIVSVIAINNVNKFDDLMKGVTETKPSITIIETDNAKLIKLPDDEFSIAYNDSRIVMAYGQNINAVSLVNQKADESILSHPNFTDFAASDKDCSMFIDYAWMTELMAEVQQNLHSPASISPQLMEYMKGMSIYGSLNFETGKVVGDMKIYPSDAFKNYLEEFYMKPTDKLIGLLPTDCYLGFNFAIKNYSQCLKYINEEMRQQVDEIFNQYGLSEEIIDNIHGDILMGVYQDPDNAMIPGIVLAIQCKNRTLFNKVKELMMITTESNMFEIPNMGYCVTYIDNVLVISTKALYNQCLASGEIKAWDKSWKNTSMGQILKKGGIAIDFQAICKNSLLIQMSGNKELAMMLSIFKQLETLTMQMESMQESQTELILVNKDKNALEQLIAIGIGAAMTR